MVNVSLAVGCMAERLKTKLVEQEKNVDLVCGPDAYRDLPRMLALTESGQTAGINISLLKHVQFNVHMIKTWTS